MEAVLKSKILKTLKKHFKSYLKPRTRIMILLSRKEGVLTKVVVKTGLKLSCGMEENQTT